MRSVCISPSPPLPDRMQNLGGFFFVENLGGMDVGDSVRYDVCDLYV